METSRYPDGQRCIQRAPDAPGVVAQVLSNSGVAFQKRGEPERAWEHFTQSLAIEEGVFGPNTPAVARSLNNLAFVAAASNRSGEAEPRRRALSVCLDWFGPDHPAVALSQFNLAGLLRETARADEAEGLYHTAQKTLEQSFGRWHPHLANVVNWLALLEGSRGNSAEAQTRFTRALEILDRFSLTTNLTPPNREAAQMNLLRLLLRGRKMPEQSAFELIAGVLRRVAAEVPEPGSSISGSSGLRSLRYTVPESGLTTSDRGEIKGDRPNRQPVVARGGGA